MYGGGGSDPGKSSGFGSVDIGEPAKAFRSLANRSAAMVVR